MSKRTMNETHQKKKPSVPPTQVVDLFDKRWVKLLLFVLIPAAVFVLISAGIRVSQYGIDHTIVIMCPQKLVAGSNSAMRVTLIDDASGFFLPQRITATLTRNGRVHTLFDSEVMESGFAVSRNFRVPSVQSGPATLKITVFFDSRFRIIEKRVHIVADYPRGTLSTPSDVKPDVIVATAKSGDATLRLYPEGRGAPAGLPSLLFVQTVDGDTQPLPAPYLLQMPVFKKGEQATEISGVTDELGLDAFVIAPTDLHYPIKVLNPTPPVDRRPKDASAVSDTDSTPPATSPAHATDPATAPENAPDPALQIDTADTSSGASHGGALPAPEFKTLAPAVVYSGIKMDFKSPIIPANQPIDMTLQQISGAEPVYLDVFKGNQWLHSETGWVGDDGNASFSFAPPATGILRIQASSSPLRFSRNIAVRHVYVEQAGPKPPKNRTAAILTDILSQQTDPVQRRWLDAVIQRLNNGMTAPRQQLLAAFALSRLYRGHSELPELISSRKDDDAALNGFKHKFQIGLTIAILMIGFSVAVLIFAIAIQAAKKQKALTQLIMDGTDDNIGEMSAEDEADESSRRQRATVGRYAQWIQIGILFLVVLAAFAAIALLIMTLSWNQTPGL
ncbi:MAG: hypothetical protein JXX14_23890 [Deltaproteobacteria bacterium]|nr:hypothetical protein [Deltaproteobacteria bacterium]